MTASPPGPSGPEFDPPAPLTPGSGPNPHPGRFDPTGAQAQPSPGQPSEPVLGPAGGEQTPPSGHAPATAPDPAYPPAAGYPPAPVGGGLPGEPPPPAAPERVGLGLAAAVVVVLACCVLTAAIYHWGFIASITAWVMAIGASWAYTKVGGEPVKGRIPLLLLILVGIVLGFLSMVASAVWDFYWEEMGSTGTTQEAVDLVLGNLFNGELWQELGADALFYFLFAALGAFGVVRRMAGAGRPKP